MFTSYIDSATKRNALNLLVELDGQIVGSGGITAGGVSGRKANVGLQFVSSARGHGLGKLTMRLLLRLSNEFREYGIRAGTMKANLPMRAVMKSLGIEETDGVFEIPGFGVVNDILYEKINKEDWKDFEFQVEFLETGPGIT
jgi:RimJ/RimL family protein N-acetyltransferase